MNIIDKGPCTAQSTHPFVKLATILLSRERLLCSLLIENSTKVPGSRPLGKRQKQKSAAHLNRQVMMYRTGNMQKFSKPCSDFAHLPNDRSV